MPTWEQVVERYGKDVADRMAKSRWLDCITCYMNEEGVAVIPQRDIDIALRAINGEEIGDWEWD